MSAPEPDVFAKALEGVSLKVAAKPASVTTLNTNTPAGYVSIELPSDGNLWVYFTSQGEPKAKVWQWNESTLFTKIDEGVETVLTWHKEDRLVYQLGFPEQQLSLSWGYE
jgi:hypothetical protein